MYWQSVACIGSQLRVLAVSWVYWQSVTDVLSEIISHVEVKDDIAQSTSLLAAYSYGVN